MLVIAIIVAGEGVRWAGRYYQVGLDLQEVTCMPSRVSVIELGNDGEFHRGDLVAFRTDRAGEYIGADQLMGKRVAAIPGDQVTVKDLTLYINGQSRRDLGLCRRKYLTQYCDDRDGVVPTGHLLMLADHADSYDGRYWGAIPSNQVVGRIIWPAIPEPASDANRIAEHTK